MKVSELGAYIDDAPAATCAVLTADPGVYNVVDDQPVAQSVWLPAFANFAPEPPTVSEEEALRNSGPDSVYYATRAARIFEPESKSQAGIPSATARMAPVVSKRNGLRRKRTVS